MISREFMRRMLSTKKMNLKYFLKRYFRDAQFYIENEEMLRIDNVRRKAYNICIVIEGKEEWGFVMLNKRFNGFILIIPQKERAIRFTMSTKNLKRAKVEYFKKSDKGKYFKSRWGNYLKIREESMII
mgnify:CR=1 FL=1